MKEIKEESGVMIMKNGKAWGIEWQDYNATSYGWIEPIHAPIHDPKFCKKPSDAIHKNSSYEKELLGSELIFVTRITETTLIIN